MSVQNQRDEQNNEKKENIEGLKKLSSIAYSLSGWLPSSVSWELTKEQYTGIILKFAKQFLGEEVRGVQIDPDRKNGMYIIRTYILLSKNSPHLFSNELNNPEYAVKKKVRKLSNELNEFMKRFCTQDMDQVIYDDSFNAIEIDAMRIIKLEMDEQGIEYGKIYGEEYKRKYIVTVRPSWSDNKKAEAMMKRGEIPPIERLEICKAIGTRKQKNARIHAKGAFNVKVRR